MIARRNSDLYFLYIAIQLVLLVLVAIHAANRRAAAKPLLREKQELVKTLGLTDLCLFTEARYTRHPALADVHSALQDGPLSFEHFPSGSLMMPPSHLMRKP
jgi:hypothetical protein